MNNLKKYLEPPKLYSALILISVILLTLFVLVVLFLAELDKWGNIPVGRD